MAAKSGPRPVTKVKQMVVSIISEIRAGRATEGSTAEKTAIEARNLLEAIDARDAQIEAAQRAVHGLGKVRASR
jgi:hypothetical protein